MKYTILILILILNVSAVSANYIFNSSTDWANTSSSSFAYDRNTGYLILPDNTTDGLILYQKMSGSSGVTSYDMNITSDNNGTLTNMNIGLDNGSSGWNSSGKYENAIAFDGVNDYTIIPNFPTMGYDDLTISMWVKMDANDAYKRLFYKKEDIMIVPDSGAVNNVVISVYSDFSQHVMKGSTSTTDLEGSWHHILFTFIDSTNTIQLYIDGIPESMSAGGVWSHNVGNDGELWIGGRSDGANYIKTLVDDVRIYNRTLSSDEINQTMNNTMKTTDNVTHWHDAELGHQGSQFKFIFNNDSDSFLEGWVSSDNSTWYQVTDNMTNDTLTSIPAAYKNQTQYIKAVCKGNGTSTPYLIESMITTEISSGTPTPINLAHTKDSTWVNHTWDSGTGNITNSYNISINNTWLNGTVNKYYNNSPISAGNWSNVTVWAWNSTYNELSASGVSEDVQTLGSVDITYRELNYSNLSANVLIDISNKTPGLDNISIPHIANDTHTYCFNYPNGTPIQSCITATDEGQIIWFNGSASRLPELDGYLINETLPSVNTSTIIIPANKLGMFHNWTATTNFSNIAANESNDVCYSYYNETIGGWESHYPPYSWNTDYTIPLEASVFVFVGAETTITADIVTPSNTNLYTGWNMIFIMGTDNETIANIKTDIGANCSDVWWFNSTTGDYSNTSTDTVQPCQGILPYITQNFTWVRSGL